MTGNTRWRLTAAALFFAGITLVPPAARAQGTDAAAEALYREGQRLMASGNVHDACLKFAESQKLQPANGTLINLATCHEQEGKSASAWAEFSEAAASAGRAGQAERATYAREHAEGLEKKLRTLVVEIPQAPTGTEIKLDGQSFGIVAVGTPLPVDPGEHELYVSAPKKKSWTKKVTLEAGPGATRIQVPALEDLETPTAAAPVPRPASQDLSVSSDQGVSSGSNSKRTAGFIVGGAGLAALGVGIVFGVRAKLYANRSDDEQGRAINYVGQSDGRNADVQHAAAVSDHDSAKTNQVIGIVAGAAGVAAIGTGIYLILTSKHASHASSSAHIEPVLSPTSAGANAAFTF